MTSVNLDRAPLMFPQRLTTAFILYHMPDYPELLQSYIWQDYDYPPRFPVLKKFLAFWHSSLEGRLHSVQLGHAEAYGTGAVDFADWMDRLH